MKKLFTPKNDKSPLLTCLAMTISVIISPAQANDTGSAFDRSEKGAFENNMSNEAASEEDNSLLPSMETINELNEDATEWADDNRKQVKDKLNDWAHNMDDWFGEPDPDDPASASLRIVLDTRWVDDPVEGSNVTVKPRVRGKLKLPVLERRLSLIIGNEELDEEEILTKGSSYTGSSGDGSYEGKTFDRKQARADNTSIALRWSKIEEALGFDADIGIRSGDDIYLKLSADRGLYEKDNWRVSSHNYYRYGSQSEHTLKGELNFQYLQDHNSYVNNNISIRYRHEDEDEETTWSNELREIHSFGKNKTLSYGLSAFGSFDDSKPSLNSYGPTLSYRQPFWRDWLFVQTELNYFNDKQEDKDHFPSALLRLEALF